VSLPLLAAHVGLLLVFDLAHRLTLTLALLGAAVILLARWRSGLLLLALPLYYLSTESFFLYEWRVAVPMHYALFACAAAPVVAAWSALRAAAGSAPGPPDQNQAG